ncbi:MAG: iron-containing alcohol dehydrogenase [Candidimonas sp.]|nr:MAG: iron-containing alcohol dehydrogenase [Candidimonas sp.]TAM26759.1 MAG: iron-containing alcohol dehydrogenase [Candidimonas sp.]TAM74434.1 MAG: iron-containing alcohol dehydrogenase [Candidimonas sp.]
MLLNDKVFMAWPSRIIFGAGQRAALAPLLKKQGYRNALIVTDTFFTSAASPIIRNLIEALDAVEIRHFVFDGGHPDPTVLLCENAYKLVREKAADIAFDHIIAVGGGSNIDLAKVLSVTLKYGGHPEDYIGEGRLPGKPMTLVAMPTTSGAGSEVTPGAILVAQASSTKVALMGNDLRPSIVVVDPELTLSCPPKVTADAGIDALTHAIESYLTCDSTDFDRGGDPDPGYSGRNHITQLMAGESIRLCFEHLPTAYGNGADLEARTGMAYASLLAAFSYASAGLNAVHALAYALAGLTHASHGSTNAVFLPYVMDSLRTVRRADMAKIGHMAGAGTEMREEQAARHAIVHTRELVESVGIPITLKGFGVTEHDLDTLVSHGLGVSRLTKAFPIQPAESTYRAVVRSAFDGVISS